MNSIICAKNPDFKKLGQIKIDHYDKLYEESIKSQEVFWDAIGHRIDWIKPYTKVKNSSFDEFDLHIKWELNIHAPFHNRTFAHLQIFQTPLV